MEHSLKLNLGFMSAVIVISCASLVYAFLKNKRKCRDATEALNYMNINIVTKEDLCDDIVNEIRRRSKYHHVIGFDCEWVTKNRRRQPVALLQLSTVDGYCALFRLNLMKVVPDSLKHLLEDSSVYKVGVGPIEDAKYLLKDYLVEVRSCVDLRHLAGAGGLAALARVWLRVDLDKSWKVRCSDWEADHLSDRQVKYAAADAHVAIKIFEKLIKNLKNKGNILRWFSVNKNEEDVLSVCSHYTDIAFKVKPNKPQTDYDITQNENTQRGKGVTNKRYQHATRATPLYHNCLLQAPDGELLCTCDSGKAHWYVAKGLGRVVGEAPLTVRLRFEPAGRAAGAAGRYYQRPKENKCVVCGATDSHIRKNVVPREYRKYFPEVMKEHSSHDVVLLCARCHQRSAARDLCPRVALAAACDAPLAPPQTPSHHEAQAKYVRHRQIRSAARALLSEKHVLPETRRRELEAALQLALGRAPSPALLRHAAAAPAPKPALSNTAVSHGMKVVEYFVQHDGLLRLEEYWREHFLRSMQPKYMPELWSVKHTDERLRVKFNEGRLSDSDIQKIGKVNWL